MAKRLSFLGIIAALSTILTVSAASPAISFASDLVFGPATCQRGTGAPSVFNYSFAVPEPSRGFIFKVYNGDLENTTYEQVSSSTITLNGVQILGPNNFNQNVTYLEVPVVLQAQNSLSVEVRGKPGGAIIIKVFPLVVIDTPVSGQAFSAASVSVTGHLSSVATGISVNGVSGTVTGANFTARDVPLVEGFDVLTATAVATGGIVGQASVTVTRDTTPPAITLTSPEDGATVSVPSVDVIGTVNEPSAVVLVNGSAVALAGSGFTADDVPLQIGHNAISVEARDALGNSSTIVLHVTHAPPVPTATLTAVPSQVQVGTPSALQWETTGATVISITPGIGAVAASGTLAISPAATTSYTLTAVGPGGAATATTVVTVVPAGIQAGLSAASASIVVGETTTLSWSTNDATDVIIEPGVGRVASAGSLAISPTSTTRYLLTAVGSTGVASAAAVVSVRGAPVPAPAGAFGQGYSDLIPSDATLAAYDQRRFAVVTGLVEDRAGQPLAGVGVTVRARPDLGTALSDAEGRYSLPVEGGGLLTLTFSEEGLLSTQRHVRIGWNEVAAADTVVMIAADPVVTTIAPDGDPSHAFVHRGSEVTTEFGTRAATVVLTGDTRAYAQTETGEVEIPSFELRATEFDSPEAMPAHLPPTSAFTYCVDLSASGLENVRFSKPVTVYVDNFLGFDVGINVPAGSYDYQTAIWMPSADGKVVRLLDLDGDGVVDALDAGGDGLADDLNGDGSFADEVIGLGDATRYPPGATFWRVNISHLTPWDFNWSWSFSADDIPPNPKSDPFAVEKPSCDEAVDTGSYVECQGRVLHENLPIPGTDLSLHYASDRTEGHQTVIIVPASGETVPATLLQIVVKLRIAGRELVNALPPASKQVARFTWDGKDHLGRSMTGTVPAEVMIGFTYNAVYYATRSAFETSFARAGGNGKSMATAVQVQKLVTSWKHIDISVHRDSLEIGEIGSGWTLSGHHRFSPSDPTVVYKGDGSVLEQGTQILTTLPGSHNGAASAWDGHCSVYRNATYCSPTGLTSDAAGNLYLADSGRHCIRKVDRNGTVTTIAGREHSGGYAGDGGPATQALLNQPFAIASDPAGNLYISDTNNRRVRKVDTTGVITTVAGNGTCYGLAENIPAVQAAYCPQGPTGTIAADAWGNIYLADRVNRVVRRVRPDGIIENIVQYPTVYDPAAVAVDSLGNLYIADTAMSWVLKYSTTGKLSRFAGNGVAYGNTGDGGPAVSAMVDAPEHLFVDKGGNVYISGWWYVRKVDTDGIISTVTGIGANYGGTGSGTPAVTANVAEPGGLTVTGDGSVFVVSVLTNTIQKVSLPGVSESATYPGDLQYADPNGLGYIFTQSGRHKATVDLRTGVTLSSFVYGPAGLDSVSDRFGNAVRIERDGTGQPTAIVAPDGQTTELHLDAVGDLRRVVYPDGTSRTMAYDAGGLMTDAWDPRGNHSHHDFDSTGRVLDTFDGEGGHRAWTQTFDYTGKFFTSLQAPEGDYRFYAEEEDATTGYTSTRTAPDGSIGTYFRAADGLRETMTPRWGGSLTSSYTTDTLTKARLLKEFVLKTPAALTLRQTFVRSYLDTDADGIMDTVTDTATVNTHQWRSVDSFHTGTRTTTSPASRATTLTYLPESLLAQRVQVEGLLPADFTYDARGRLESVTVGGRTTSLVYDLNGNPDYLVTPDDQTYDYTYDPMGRLRAEARPDGTTVEYHYDESGNLSVLTNPNLVAYGFGHNANNQRLRIDQPLSGSFNYRYDKERRLQSVSLPSGRTIQNTYLNGNLIAVRGPEGTTSLSYWSGGRLASASRNGEGFSLIYDGSLVLDDIRSGAIAKTISYGYNNDLAVSSMTYAGATIAFGYDVDGLLTSADGFTISRDVQNGLPLGVSGLGLTQTRSFSGHAELDGAASSIAGVQAYAWSVAGRDNAGRITRREETLGGDSIVWEYSYNAFGRLETVKKDSAVTESYGYDANGNRTTETNPDRGIDGQINSYSAEDHVLSAGSDTYIFDVDGFLQSKTSGEGTTHYQYSSRGELLRADVPNGTIVNYMHDPLGRRIVKQVNGTAAEKYLWADRTTLLAVYDGSDNLLQRYTYADARVPVSMTMGGAIYFLLTDQVGTLRAVADTSGAIVKRIDYDSFGIIIADSNPAFTVPFGFAGGLHDRDTGFVRFGYRDYSPELGRFTAKDPIDFAGGDSNLYAYVSNDPVNLVDSWGLFGEGGPGAKFKGHWDFTGGDQFDYNREDTDPKTEPVFGAPEHHFRDITVSEVDVRAALESCNNKQFERAMHRGQDYFTHYAKGYRWRPGKFGEKCFGYGHGCDKTKPDKDPFAWSLAEKWSKARVAEWQLKCESRGNE